jgi:hypothetical protein
LCDGVRIPGDTFFGDHRYDWPQAAGVLQNLLGPIAIDSNAPRCIAIIASHLAAAEPLLEVAENSGCSAVWCRDEGGIAIRGIDQVWWDDSLAVPTDTSGWTQRLTAMQTPSSANAIKHTWITNRVHWLQVQQAKEAGVSLVLTKPYPLQLLRQTIGSASDAPIVRQAA